MGLQGTNSVAQVDPATAWNQYAAAAAWSVSASNNNPPINSDGVSAASGEDAGRLSGKDIRERLREQVGWTEPPYEEDSSNNGLGSGRDRDRDTNSNKWKEKKWQKKNKNKNKGNKFNDHGQHQSDTNNSSNGGGKGMCKYYTKGACHSGEACRFSHADDAPEPGKVWSGKGDGTASGGGGAGSGTGSGSGGRGGWKDRKKGGHGGHGHGHHGGGGGKLDAEAGRSEWVEGLEY